MMSKILIVTNHSYMLYRFREELIRELVKEHEVVLSMPFVGHEEDFQAMGIRCIPTRLDRRGMCLWKEWRLLTEYRALLRQEKPDLVLTYSIKPNIYAGLACTLAGIPYCANVQGLGTAFHRRGLSALATVLYRLGLSGAKTVFFENQADAETFLRRHIVTQDRIRVLPGAGVNLERCPCLSYPDNRAVHFLYLGRIMAEKGVLELFQAFRKLHEELGGGVVLDLVGFYEDDACREEAQRLKAAGLIVEHGFQTNPVPFYARADCVVLPSHHEGMSNVLLEAAAVGRPVITSDISGCREAVEPEQTGFLCRVSDAEDLLDQLRRMAVLSVRERAEMGLRARAKMERDFDRRNVVQMTLEALFSGGGS